MTEITTTVPIGSKRPQPAPAGQHAMWSFSVRPSKTLPSVLRLLRANVLLSAMSFLTSLLIARAFDPTARGVLANVLLWPMVFAGLASLGVPVYLSREVAAHPERAAQLYRHGYAALSVGCVLALAADALLWFCNVAAVTDGGLGNAVVAALVIPFSLWNSFQVQMELGRNRLATYTWARGSFTISYGLAVLAAWLTGARRVDLYVWAFLLAAVFAAISTHELVRRDLRAIVPSTPMPTAIATTLRASFANAVANALIAASTSLDRIVISLVFDARAMGIYVVAFTLTQVQSIVNEAIAPLFFRNMAATRDNARADPIWLALRLRQTTVINTIVCAALMAATPFVVPVLFGRKYEGAIMLVVLLLPAIAMRSMMRPFEEVLKGLNRPMSQSLAVAVMTSIFLAGAGIAASLGQLNAIPVAMMASSFSGLVLVAHLVARETHIALVDLLVPRPRDALALVTSLRQIVGG